MPRLHLKRTPEEEERRARKKAKKEAKEGKRARKEDTSKSRKQYYNEPADSGPSFPQNDDDLDEEARFQEKLNDALADDGLYDPTQRLDNAEARLNSFAHIPRRWRGTDDGFSAGLWMEDAASEIGLEPWQMNDDEYSEYMRAGMWRKKHQAEFQERLRIKEQRAAREEQARRVREETRRLEHEAEAEREQRKNARAARRTADARRLYEERWATLLAKPSAEELERPELHFGTIAWPVLPPSRTREGPWALGLEDLTKDAISAFLFPAATSPVEKTVPARKDVLRAAMLKFHPDKFEARVLSRVRAADRARVKEAGDMVIRILNELSEESR